MPKEYFVTKDLVQYIDYIFQVKNLSLNTANSYKRDLLKLSNYLSSVGISSYKDITDETCTGWIGSLFSSNNNPRSIQRHLSSAKGFFKFLKKNLVIESSPFELVKAPKTPQHLPDVLSPEDVEQLLSLKPVDALEIRDLAIVELMYSSGLRVSETANINMSDFVRNRFL